MADAPGGSTDEDPDARLRWLNEKAQALGVKVGEVKRKDGPSPISPEDTPLFARIATEVHRELGADVPVGPEVLAGSTTDARFLRPRGLICYGLQPFPLDFFQSLTVPLGIFANEGDFTDYRVDSPELRSRIDTAVQRTLPLLAMHLRLDEELAGAAAVPAFARPDAF